MNGLILNIYLCINLRLFVIGSVAPWTMGSCGLEYCAAMGSQTSRQSLEVE